MPKVTQQHLDARRQQIVDAARARFASHGFAHTSMSDLVEASGLSVGAIYRYFASKDELVTAICAEGEQAFPAELSAEALAAFLEHVRTLAREHDHARLVAQVYAEAAVSPELAAIVERQLTALRAAVVALLPDRAPDDAERVAEAFVAIGAGYNQQLAVRGDLDSAPYLAALLAVVAS